jgi:hypothetical protein
MPKIISSDQRELISLLKTELCKAWQQAGEWLVEAGFQKRSWMSLPPASVEELEYLASLVEIPKEQVGQMTVREIIEQALVYADRRAIGAPAKGGKQTNSSRKGKSKAKHAEDMKLKIYAACLCYNANPTWKDKDIAAKVGISPSALCKADEYQRYKATCGDGRHPSGFMKADGTPEAVTPKSATTGNRNNSTRCKHCSETITAEEVCCECGNTLVDQCLDCHNEKAHKVLRSP